jgi:hypothetical protein
MLQECAHLCVDQGADCPAFSIDYNGQRCFVLDRNTQVRDGAVGDVTIRGILNEKHLFMREVNLKQTR